MGKEEDIYKKGLKVNKEEELAKHKTDAETNFKAVHFMWIREQFHIEKIDIDRVRTLASNYIDALEAYQGTFKEIQEL